MTLEELRERLERTIQERDTFRRQAEQRLAALEGQVALLEELVATWEASGDNGELSAGT